MPERVPAERSKNRCRRLQEVARELSLDFYRSYSGREVMVLAEEWDAGVEMYRGYSERYIPVRFNGPAGLSGRIVPVWVRMVELQGVVGEWSGNFCKAPGRSIDVPSTSAYVT